MIHIVPLSSETVVESAVPPAVETFEQYTTEIAALAATKPGEARRLRFRNGEQAWQFKSALHTRCRKQGISLGYRADGEVLYLWIDRDAKPVVPKMQDAELDNLGSAKIPAQRLSRQEIASALLAKAAKPVEVKEASTKHDHMVLYEDDDTIDNLTNIGHVEVYTAATPPLEPSGPVRRTISWVKGRLLPQDREGQ